MLVVAAVLAFAGPAWAQERPPEKKLTFAFKEASLEALLLYVSEVTGWIFVQEAPLRGTVTAFSRAEVPASRCLEFLETCLRPHGLAVRSPAWPRAPIAGDTVRIVDAAKAMPTLPGVHVGIDAAEIPVTDALRTQILPLKSVSAAEVTKDLGEVLRKAMGEGGQVAISTYANAIVLTGRSEGIHRAAEILRVIDETASAQLRITVFPLEHADATELVKILNEICKREPAKPEAGGQLPGLLRMMRAGAEPAAPRSAAHEILRLTAEPRTNSILVSATEENQELIQGLLRRLDRPSAALNTYIVPLRNGDAATIAGILDALWNGKARTAQPPAAPVQPAPSTPTGARRQGAAAPRR